MHKAVDRLGDRWNDIATVTAREKASFVCGVVNIFICGLLIGGYPTWFHIWYTVQLLILMPARYISYHRIGYHYFLADMCYFVNFLAMLSIWCFPGSKRLFISTFSLAFGNNAIAIALWRNSLVFHSLDKVTSVSIHLLPPVTLHCLTHLTPTEILKERFPAIHHIKFSPSDSPDHYGLTSMMLWATVPYAIWQLAYYFLINVRRADKIAAGRPTSFTWLKKSYAKTAIGKSVLSLPESLQEAAFMTIQYSYALLTIIPCPFWFWYKHASSAFLFVVFTWGVYNGATFYIDVFGNRFRKELDQLKREVAKWQNDSLQIENGQGAQTVPRSPASAPAQAQQLEEIEKKNDLSALPPLDKKAESAPDGSTSTGVGQQGQQRDQEDQDGVVRNRTATGANTENK
ncbi:hypothetical protein KEM54_002235 [Ascosphaera aggregata]|nr:hypothetical protein KEM54_002235 [Ascosphaera aggregata]